MVFRVTGNTVINSSRQLSNVATFGVDNTTGSITFLDFSPMIGTVAGFTTGGATGPATGSNVIDKFPFASDTNASDVGDLTQARWYGTGQSSATNGYTSVGFIPGNVNTIDKFVFSNNLNAVDIGDATAIKSSSAGHSSPTHGYISGGEGPSAATNTIEKFPFAVDASSGDVGDLLTPLTNSPGGISSSIDGFVVAGYSPPAASRVNTIQRFPFATDSNASDVGDLTAVRDGPNAISGKTHGYSTGGNPGPTNTIEKFPYSTSTNATDVADLFLAITLAATSSSTASGYAHGGNASPAAPAFNNTIQKFSFATDSNGTDVGDLTVGRFGPAGQQD